MASVPEFRSYIPPGESPPEFTPKAILLGMFFGILFGAATVYLALRAGLTVSASVPIAVLAITILAIFGGTLGVLFMIPLRRALIVKEHGKLPYPEGTACADVLIAGERGGNLAKMVFAGV